MKLLFIGDAAATGFGTVTYDLGGALLNLGVDVRFMSMNIANVLPPEPFGSRTYDVQPNERPEAVLGILTGEGRDWTPDAILMVSDFYSADWVTYVPPVLEALQRVPSFHYCPVEGIGLPREWGRLWSVVRPIAMSTFGQKEMARIVGYEPPMIYHGVDQSVFYPIAANRPSAHVEENGARATNKASAKQSFGLDPNRTMILRTDRNMPRKRYPSMLRALLPVFQKHQDVDLVIHCKPWDEGGNLYHVLSNFPEWFQSRVLFTLGHDSFQGYSRERLNLLYNAADLYCSTSAEGFGLTVAEAIACGVPVLGMDYSAVPEVIGPAGQVAPVSHLIDNEYAHFWAAVDEQAYGAMVDRLLSKPSLRRQLGALGPAHVAKHFNWTRSAEQFLSLISSALVSEAA